MKLLNILNYKALGLSLLYLALILVTFQISMGSYGENEPQAGSILMVAGLIFSIIGVFLLMKFKPTYILWEKLKR